MKMRGLLPAQKEFAEAINEKYSAIVGGFRSGKTRAIIPRYCKLSVKRKGDVKLLVISPTYRLLMDSIVPLFVKFFDANKINYKWDKSDVRIYVKDRLRGEIIFRSGDDPQKIIAFECTDVVIDEFDTIRRANQDELWEKAIARMSGAKDSTIGVTTTPEGYKKTYELFDEQSIGKLIKARTKDNYYLPEDYIKMLEDQYDAVLIKQYMDGEFVNINQMQAYYAFNRDCIGEYKRQTNNVLVGIDFNVDPLCAVIGEKIKDELVIYDELYLRNSNTFRLVEVLKSKYKNITAYPDMTGTARKTSAAMTDIQILQKGGIRISGIRNPRVKDRIQTVNSMFSAGKIKIDKKCKYLIKDLEQVSLDKYGEIDKSVTDLTHISDALGYMIYRLFPIKEKSRWEIRGY